MALKGVSCIRGDIDMAEHKRCMLHERPCGVPPTVLESMTNPNTERKLLYEQGGTIYSPSSINACHRQYTLKEEYDYYLPVPEDAWPTTRGTILHAGLAKEPAPEGSLGVVRELRLASLVETKYGGKSFSGQMDEVLLVGLKAGALHVIITDWKTKSDIAHSMLEAEPQHIMQINYYNWLVQRSLLDYLSNWNEYKLSGHINLSARLVLNQRPIWQRVQSVVVDELAICYLAGNKVRTFSSNKLLTVRGKMRGYYDEDGHWHRCVPAEYEEIEINPLRRYVFEEDEAQIVAGIEAQVDAETVLAPPLTDARAPVYCPRCPVREKCVEVGLQQGYQMREQLPYVDKK